MQNTATKVLLLNIFKRVYLSQLGFSDVVLEGGKVFGNVPFPLLYIHKANQTYAYQLQSYNLMNFMEFVSDRYVRPPHRSFLQWFFPEQGTPGQEIAAKGNSIF